MAFCDDDFNDVELVEVITEIQDVLRHLVFGSLINSSFTVIENMALARKLNDQLQRLVALISEYTTKSLLCKIISDYDLNEELETVARIVEDTEVIYNDFEERLGEFNGFTIEDAESFVANIQSSYDPQIEAFQEKAKEKVREVFSVLEYIGASSTQIDEVVENTPFQTDVKAYVEDIFTSLMDEALSGIGSSF